MSNDYRRAKRRKANEAIDVLDSMTEAVVGQVSNLSETGMLLIVRERMVSDALYQFSLQLPTTGSQRRTIELGAHELWSDDAGSSGQSLAGFRFIDMSPEDAAHIRHWVESPGGQYV